MSKAGGARLLHRQLNAARRAGLGVAGVELGDPCESDVYALAAVLVGPDGCPYAGGRFALTLTFSEEYPQRPPKGVFHTHIFHPNVSPTTGEICVSALQRDWQPDAGLGHIMLALRSLLMNPNPDSALNEAAGRMLTEDYAAFCARASLLSQIHAQAPAPSSAPKREAASESDEAQLAAAPEDASVKENAPVPAKRARRL